MTRPFLPTDLISLFLRGNSLSNTAKTWENLGRKETPFSLATTLLKQWGFPGESRNTWIYRDKEGIQGLLSVRGRSSAEVWQVDYLLLAGERKETCLELLGIMSTAGGTKGVEKVFLRLPEDNALVEVVKSSGFSVYGGEVLYWRERKESEQVIAPPALHLRLKENGDDYRVYELFSASVPAAVRQAEGITFAQWQKTREKGYGKGMELIGEEAGSVIAWLRASISRGGGQIELIVHPRQEEHLESLLESALDYFKGYPRLLWLTAGPPGRLGMLLRARSFEEVGRFSLLTKELLVKVPQPVPLPLQA